MTDLPDDHHDDDEVVVRPYLLTGGRTKASLPIETVVTTRRELEPGSGFATEQRAIVALCATPSAVAEVSAHLHLPLGVARVLVADLVDEGWLWASQTAGDHPEIDLVERLISGLRALA
jgi:Protein of unknown function (DUF742)